VCLEPQCLETSLVDIRSRKTSKVPPTQTQDGAYSSDNLI